MGPKYSLSVIIKSRKGEDTDTGRKPCEDETGVMDLGVKENARGL